MSCMTEAYCVDCRTSWYCGYGSYGGFTERAKKSPVAEHEALGHETGIWMEDCNSITNGDLIWDGDPFGDEKLRVKDYASFNRIDLSS